jgi:Na+-driven multidrug efflux pump
MAIGVMLLVTAICQLEAAALIRVFSKDAQVIDVGSEYLTIVSWTFPASGVIFVGGSMFQALGHTLPALIASFARIILVGIPAFILAQLSGFQLRWIWYLSVIALIVQLAVNQLLLFQEFRRRLTFAPAAVA